MAPCGSGKGVFAANVRRQKARIRKTEQVNTREAENQPHESPTPGGRTDAVDPHRRDEHHDDSQEQLKKRVDEEHGRADERGRQCDDEEARDAQADEERHGGEECHRAPPPRA